MDSNIRTILWNLLGNLPKRPAEPQVTQVEKTETSDYHRQDFKLWNNYDTHIPASLLLPINTKPPYPAVIYLHAHGHHYETGRDELYHKWDGAFAAAETLTKAGYAVLCIDAYAFGERQHPDETTLFKRFLWEGKTLWGMMLRDDLISLDYLISHPEIDAHRIGVLGMSMGSTRAWWLAALDERIKVTGAIACLPRYQDLIDANALAQHSIYFFVPGILQYMDTEQILAQIAPRPLLCLTGDKDPTSPIAGVRKIESHLADIYINHNAQNNFKSVIYEQTGHTFNSDMWQETMRWFAQHL